MKDFLKQIKLNENNIGFGLGVAVMVFTGLLLINYFKSLNNKGTYGVEEAQTMSTSTDQPATASAMTAITPKPSTVITPGELKIVGNEPDLGATLSQLATDGTEYKVTTGDSLWKIAEKEYGSGYSWTKIYEANKQLLGNNPSKLIAGTVLQLPKVEQLNVTKADGQQTAISGDTKEYTVQKGDSLWKIAVAQCSRGESWVSLAKENHLVRPSMIHAGNVFKITCPAPRL